jgi:hypothetical protein
MTLEDETGKPLMLPNGQVHARYSEDGWWAQAYAEDGLVDLDEQAVAEDADLGPVLRDVRVVAHGFSRVALLRLRLRQG